MAFYHLYTDGRYQPIIFKEESDFVFGMNAVAMSGLHCKVRIFGGVDIWGDEIVVMY